MSTLYQIVFLLKPGINMENIGTVKRKPVYVVALWVPICRSYLTLSHANYTLM